MLSTKIINEAIKKMNNKSIYSDLNKVIYRRIDKYLLEEELIDYKQLVEIWKNIFNINNFKITLFDMLVKSSLIINTHLNTPTYTIF